MRSSEKDYQTTVAQIVDFIVRHSDDTQTMDKLNKITFPFTSKFMSYQKDKETSTWSSSSYEEKKRPERYSSLPF